MSLSEVEDLKQKLKERTAQVKKLKGALEGFLECPQGVDQATVTIGKQPVDCLPYQVVVNMSCSLTKILDAQRILKEITLKSIKRSHTERLIPVILNTLRDVRSDIESYWTEDNGDPTEYCQKRMREIDLLIKQIKNRLFYS